MVNKERVRTWVRALLSGEYTQVQSALRAYTDSNDDGPVLGYCCLGVACKVAEKEAGVFTDFEHWGILPEEVKDWFGFSCNNPGFAFPMPPVPATELNDRFGWSFEKIAGAVVTEYLPGEELDSFRP